MNRILLVITFVFCFSKSFSQQFYVGFGSTISSFNYKNSQGVTLDNLLSKPNTYLGLGYRHAVNNSKTLFLSVGAMYNGYGAIGSDNRLDNYFEWEVTYLGVDVGLDIRLFQVRDFSFYIKGSVAFEVLIRGTQTVNNQVYNLVGEDEFNNTIFFTRASFGVQHPIARNTSIFANYTYGNTVLIGKGNAADQEQLKLNTHQFGIGLIISLPNCNCPF